MEVTGMDKNAITMPDGTPLRATWLDRPGQWIESSVVIETERAANREAISIAFWIRQHNERYRETAPRDIVVREIQGQKATLERCLAALAHKRGTTVEVERAVLAKKVERKYRRVGLIEWE